MRFILNIICLLTVLPGLAQFSPQYNSYMFNGLAINPAYTGTRECLSAVGIHTAQWTGFDGAPMTQFLSVHTPLNNHHAVGLNLYNDRVGVQNEIGIFPSYAYNLNLTKTQKLSFGIDAGVNFFNVRNSDVLTNNDDVTFQENVRMKSVPNIGAGLYYYSKNYYVGLSAPKLFSNQLSTSLKGSEMFQFNTTQTVFILSSGGTVKITKDLIWKPSLLIKAMISNAYQVDLNSNFYYIEKLWAGVSYRHKDAFIGLIGFRFNSKFDVGYSYSYPLSNIVRISSGSHEIMVRFELRKKVDTFNSRYF